MSYRFFEIFDQKFEIFFSLAKLLEGGKSLTEALENLAFSCQNPKFRNAARLAVDSLKNGSSAEDVFANKVFSTWPLPCRYILSCPVTDELKGKMLSGWFSGRINFSLIPDNLAYPINILAVVSITLISIRMFVLPQFKEIMISMQFEPTLFRKLISMFEFSFSNPIFILFLFLVGLTIFIIRRYLISSKEIQEQILLLSIIEAVDLKDRPIIFALLGNKALLPIGSNRAKAVADSLMAGKNIAEACEIAQMPASLSWFLSLGFASENSTEMLGYGKEFLRNLLNTKMQIFSTLMEVGAIVSLGFIFGSMVYGIFEILSLILQKVIS